MSFDYECLEKIETKKTVSQGDVISWSNPQDFQSKVAVVVTADCDLAFGKHWGRITVIPLVPIENYLEQVYFPKQLESCKEELFSLFTKEVEKVINSPESSPSNDILESLVSMDSLPASIEFDDKARLVHKLLRHTRGFATSMSSRQALDEVLRLRNKKDQTLSSTISNFLGKPPGDCMILPRLSDSVPGLHVAFLRAMREVKDRDIAIKTSEISSNGATRIGRLVPVLRYRLTQMLAQVFSDIGLPNEYEGKLKEEKNNFVKSINQPQKEQA